MKVENIFAIEDKFLPSWGLYALWTCIYISSFVALLVDRSNDTERLFNIIVNGISVIYPAIYGVNSIYGNGKQSSFLMISGSIHQYAFWILFAFFHPDNILSGSPVGVMNWILCFVIGVFATDMIFKTWWININMAKYLKYVKNDRTAVVVDES